MSRKLPVYLLAVILLLWWGGGQGWTQAGKIFYVSPQGDDTNPGTTAKPWRTLQHAADRVQSGDTVYVKSGTYKEEVRLTRSGKAKAPITFAAVPHEQVTVQHFFLKRGVSHIALRDFIISGFKVWGLEVSGDNNHLLFSGLKIKGGEVGVRLTVGHSGGGPEYGPVSHVTMENCLIQESFFAGVDGTPGPCNYLIFRRVEVTRAGQGREDSYAADGISIEKGHHITVDNCYIHDNGGDGIDLNSRDRGGRVPDIVVRRNVVVRNHLNGIKLWSGGRMEGNVVWGQGDTPIWVGPYRGRLEMLYNTVAYNMWAKEFGGRNYATAIGYPEEGVSKPRLDLIMHHNIFAFNAGPAHGDPAGIYLGPGLRLLEEHHNLFYSFPEKEVVALFLGPEGEFSRKDIQQSAWAKATGQGKGDLSVNPRFVSGWPRVDLHLKSGSPAAGRGAYAYPSAAGSTSVAPTGKESAKTADLSPGSPQATSPRETPTKTAARSPVPGTIIFSDTFEDGWDSRWFLSKNISVVKDTEAKGHVLVFKAPSLAEIRGLEVKDTTVEFRVKPTREKVNAPSLWVGLRVHAEPPQQSSYKVVFFQQRLAIQREIGKQRRTLAQVHKGLTPGVWQKVAVKLEGGQIETYVDGKLLLTAKDTKNLPPGVVALFCHEGSPGFAIDDVTLTSTGAQKSH